MAEADQGEIIRVLAPLVWRVADKMFKVISWTAIVVALRLAAQKTGSHPVQVLAGVATLVLGAALASQAFYLAARDPAGLGLPASWHRFARPLQFVFAIALFLAIGGPPLFLDQIIAALASAR